MKARTGVGGATSSGSRRRLADVLDGLLDGLFDEEFDGLLLDPGLGVLGDLPLDGGYGGANRLLEGARGRRRGCVGRGGPRRQRRLGRGDRERDGAGHGRGEQDLRNLDLDLGLHRVDQSRLEPLQPAARVDGLGNLLGLRLLRLLADRAHDDGFPALRRLTVQVVAGPGLLRRVRCGLADAEGRGRCDPRSDHRIPLDRRGGDSGCRQPAGGTGGGTLGGALGRLGLLSLLGGLLLVVVREPAAEQVVRRGLLALGVGSHIKTVRRQLTPRDRFAEGRPRRVQLGSVDSM